MNSKRRCLYCLSENVTVNIDVQNFTSLIQENKFYIGKPVIFFSFAFIKTGSIDSIKFAVKMIIRNVFDRFRDIMNSDLLLK